MIDTINNNNKQKANVIKSALALFLESTIQLVEMRISTEDHAIRCVAIMESVLDIAMQEIASREAQNAPKA